MAGRADVSILKRTIVGPLPVTRQNVEMASFIKIGEKSHTCNKPGNDRVMQVNG
jgi:hypothetical protein